MSRHVSTGLATSKDPVLYAVEKRDADLLKHMVEYQDYPVTRAAYNRAHELGEAEIIRIVDDNYDPYGRDDEGGLNSAFTEEELAELAAEAERVEEEAVAAAAAAGGVSLGEIDDEFEQMMAENRLHEERAYDPVHAAILTQDPDSVREALKASPVTRDAYDLAHSLGNRDILAIVDDAYKPYTEAGEVADGAFTEEELAALAAAEGEIDEAADAFEADVTRDYDAMGEGGKPEEGSSSGAPAGGGVGGGGDAAVPAAVAAAAAAAATDAK